MKRNSMFFMFMVILLFLSKNVFSSSETTILVDADIWLGNVENCEYVIKNKQLDMRKAETTLCMEDYLLSSYFYPNDLSLLFIRKMNASSYPDIKKNALFNKLLKSLKNAYTLYPEMTKELLKAGAISEDINIKIIEDFQQLDCKSVIDKKTYSSENPVTLMCLISVFDDMNYSNEKLIKILDELEDVNHPIKNQVLDVGLVNMTSAYALERLPVIKKMLASGVNPDKIVTVDSANLGNHTDALCKARKWIYDAQHEYLINQKMSPAIINFNYLLNTSSCHRIVCNDLIIELANRNKKSANFGTPLHDLFGDFSLAGGDVNVVKALITSENINSLNAAGDTPLHCLVNSEFNRTFTEAMKMLIEAGADINIKNKEGKSVNDLITEYPELDFLREIYAKAQKGRKLD